MTSNSYKQRNSELLTEATSTTLRRLAFLLAPLAALACSAAETSETAVASARQFVTVSDCGYSVSAEVKKVTKKGFRARVKIKRTGGGPLDSTGFTVRVSSGAAKLVSVGHGTFQAVDGGYLLSTVNRPETEDDLDGDDDTTPDPDVLAGRAYRFHLKFEGTYNQLTANIISSGGVNCDQTAPTIELTTSGELVTSSGTLTLSATASDNVGVSKVVFLQDGVQIGVDQTAPYTLAVPVTSALNGRHRYTATAFDLTSNQGSETKRVLVAIGNKFFGSAPSNAAEYAGFLDYFDQITPANAGKWGSVEATRDQMIWTDLDTAYQFAKTHDIPFKFHTLVWGQQQPSWIAGLPAAEQLVEIEEWMAAVAERYPDIELIDVVNEPLHAAPSYAAALGGAGATGWDWVVKAFDMARNYFPNSELLINDYSILSMASATSDYLNIVRILKDRGLVDGIGEQAHFYERAPELSVLQTNLSSFAATGLPIYVSELDLNLADDAHQANRMKDLFSIFWSHASVLGITHWGHLQGSTWQPNAYLVRSNGAARPALTWIDCHRSGGTTCTVPPYVPQPRAGDDDGITLEAEEYDGAQSLLPAGNVVAYANDGSWFRFDRVVFNDQWNELNVTYANGNTTGTPALSIHVGSLENAAVGTLTLAPTGGWGTLQTVSIPWMPITGERTVFVKFNGGGANVDKLQFAAPTTTVDIIPNGTFESGASGWYTFNGGSLTASTTRAHGGTQSLSVTNRTNNAPAATDITSLVTPGTSYPFSAWISISSPDGSSKAINVTQATTCRNADGTNGTTYAWISGPTTLAGDASWAWVQFHGTVAVPNCTLVQLQLFIEGGVGSDLYVDDVQLLRTTGSTNLITDGTFESGQGNWGGWGATSIDVTTASAHSGAQSFRGVGMSNGALSRDVTSLVTAGRRYQATVWVSLANVAAGAGQVRFQTIQRCNAATSDSYPWLAGNTVANGAWVQLTGTVDLSACTSVEKLQLFAGTDSGDLYIDDVALTLMP